MGSKINLIVGLCTYTLAKIKKLNFKEIIREGWIILKIINMENQDNRMIVLILIFPQITHILLYNKIKGKNYCK